MQAAVAASACSIGDISDELLVNIVSQLRVERGCLVDERAEERRRSQNSIIVRTLHALTLSCQKFNGIATPFLYQSFIQTKAQPCTQLQLRTLMDKHELAQFVQYIEFDTFSTSIQIGHKSPAEVDVSKYRKQLVDAQWRVPPPETTSQMVGRIMGYGVSDSVSGPKLCPIVERLWDLTPLNAFTVLIAIADNIQDMSLPDHGPDILSLVAFKRYTHAGIFRRLWLKGTGSEMRYPLRMYCGTPDAQHGHLIEYLWRLLSDNPVCLETRSAAALKELSFDVCDANPENFRLHLQKCTSLERFSCRWRWTDQFIPWHEVNLPALHASLQHVQSTLSHLTVDTMESVWLVDKERTIPALGSLRNFKALRYLSVTGLVLWGDDEISGAPPPLSALLPDSLKTLVIKAKWDNNVEDALYQLSVDCAVQLPVLRKVECTWSPVPAFVADYLIDTYRLGGVKLLLQY
jgi:hypothetical protein